MLSRSVSADLFSGKELAGFFAVIAAVQGLAPVGAPVLGGVILNFTRWQGVFWALFAVGAVILGLCYRLRESLPPENRSDTGIAGTFRLFGPILRNRRFMLYVCLLSFSMAIMFAFIASSPFIFQGYYRLSTLGYSIYFAVNALAVTLGTILSSRFTSPDRAMRTGAALVFPLGVVTAVLLGTGLPFWVVCVPLFLTLFAAGLTFPSTATIAIESEKKNAGTASAVLGAMNFIFGGIVTPLVGLGNGLHSTAMAIGACSAMTFLLMLAAGKRTA